MVLDAVAAVERPAGRAQWPHKLGQLEQVLHAMTRSEALARLRRQVESGRPIVGCGAGTGISAKLAEAAGPT